LGKRAINFLKPVSSPVRPSVCQHENILLPLDGFVMKYELVFEDLSRK